MAIEDGINPAAKYVSAFRRDDGHVFMVFTDGKARSVRAMKPRLHGVHRYGDFPTDWDLWLEKDVVNALIQGMWEAVASNDQIHPHG